MGAYWHKLNRIKTKTKLQLARGFVPVVWTCSFGPPVLYCSFNKLAEKFYFILFNRTANIQFALRYNL